MLALVANAQNNNANTNATNANWKSNGNAATSADFFGTTNFQDVIIKSNNQERLIVDKTGNIIIKDRVNPGNGGELIISPGLINRPIPTNPIAAYMVKIGGSLFAEGELNSRSLFVQEYITYMKSLKGPRIDVDTIKMDSTRGIFGHTKIFGDVSIKQNLTVDGDATFKNKLITEKGIQFASGRGITEFIKPNGSVIYTYGKGSGGGTDPIDPSLPFSCFNPATFPPAFVNHQMPGTVQIYPTDINGTYITGGSVLNMQSWETFSSIDAAGGSDGNGGEGGGILINYFCGKDVAICAGENLNSRNGRGGVVSMGHNVQIGKPWPNDNYNIALNVKGTEQTGLFVASSNTTNPYNYGVVSSVDGESNKAFAVLLQHANSNREIITLQGNGAATFGGNSVSNIMPTLYITPSVVSNQNVIGRVGIGTNAPGASFEIKTNGTVNPLNILNQTGTANVFTVEQNGNTFVKGDLTVKGLSPAGGSGTKTVLVDASTGKLVVGAPSSTTAVSWNLGGNNITNPSAEYLGSSNVSDLYIKNGGAPRIVIKSDGKIGVGTSNPTREFEVSSGSNTPAAMIVGSPSTNLSSIYWAINQHMSYGFGMYSTSTENNIGGIFRNINAATPEKIMTFARTSAGPQVWIGDKKPTATPYSNATLSVDGSIVAKEIFVRDQQGAQWADYVFNKDYKLMPLSDVETYVNVNKHLPNVPSAKEIEEKGQGIGQLQVVQMEKIEELYLHMIELNKKVENLERENAELKLKINK